MTLPICLVVHTTCEQRVVAEIPTLSRRKTQRFMRFNNRIFAADYRYMRILGYVGLV